MRPESDAAEIAWSAKEREGGESAPSRARCSAPPYVSPVPQDVVWTTWPLDKRPAEARLPTFHRRERRGDPQFAASFGAPPTPYAQNTDSPGRAFVKNVVRFMNRVLFDHAMNDRRDVIQHKITMPAALER